MPDLMWQLEPRLAQDSVELGIAANCVIRAMTVAPWPWLVVIPRQVGATELFDLSAVERQSVLDLVCSLAAQLREEFCALKINIGALGNVVPQLHIHVVARFAGDPGWPAPVWGRDHAALDADSARAQLARLQDVVVRVRSAI